MPASNPILQPQAKAHTTGDYSANELNLANRNSGTLLETIAHDVTPVGAHYLLNHFDIPFVAHNHRWPVALEGLFNSNTELLLSDLQALPATTLRVTLECAGNGRRGFTPRWPSQPWGIEAVGTADWHGVLLRDLIAQHATHPGCRELVFYGKDCGVDGGRVHHFARSLSLTEATHSDALLAWQMNGQPLAPQHGFPLRLIVPGWYGMASVKWLNRIVAIDRPFNGYQQTETYRYKQSPEDPGKPVTIQRVRSLMIPPGIPDWSTRKRLLAPGTVKLYGRAWSGNGAPVQRVEVGINNHWAEATLGTAGGRYAWRGWHFDWPAEPGHHRISCRATDANGQTQPIDAPWDQSGFGNNAIQTIDVWCTPFTAEE